MANLTPREIGFLCGAALFLLLAVSAMASLHERHYRSRLDRIREARNDGHLETRVSCLENILTEDRLT